MLAYDVKNVLAVLIKCHR